jgi:hypothetical protein
VVVGDDAGEGQETEEVRPAFEAFVQVGGL